MADGFSLFDVVIPNTSLRGTIVRPMATRKLVVIIPVDQIAWKD
jgi:hypothetical protein